MEIEEFKARAQEWLIWYLRKASLVWQKYGLRLTLYLRSIKVPNDTKMAFLVGLVIGVVAIILVNLYPGKPYSYATGSYLTSEGEPIKRKKKKKKKNKSKGEDEGNREGDEPGGRPALEADESDEDEEGEEGETPKEKEQTSALDFSAKKSKKTEKKKGGSDTSQKSPTSKNAQSVRIGLDGMVKKDGGAEEEEDEEEKDPFADPEVVEKARKAAKYFGLTEEQLQKAVKNAKEEYRTGVAPKETGSSAAEWAALLNYGILGALVAGLIWAINRDYSNAFTKWFVTTFPDEAQTLGISFPMNT